MDHLSTPADPLYPPAEVEYVGRWDSNSSLVSFSEYPHLRGFEKDKILLGEFPGKTEAEIAAFLQEWLFFALLTEVFRICNVTVDCNDFIRQNDAGVSVLTTAPLQGYLKAWSDSEKHTTREEASRHLQGIDDCLAEANLMVDRVWRPFGYCPPTELDSLVIFTLDEALWQSRNVIYGETSDVFWRKHEFAGHRMRQNGWCPNKVFMLESLLTSSSMYYASMLKQSGDANRSHSMCTETECRTNNVDRTSYVSKHTTLDCTCQSLGPNQEHVSMALDKGGFPLIRIYKSTGDDKLQIDVVESPLEKSPTYVALSHVWSDGLGNLHGNAVPMCQLLHLNNLVSDLYGHRKDPVLFWLDTLCVPYRHDEGGRRKVAIGRMRHCYENADIVLVLDGELEASSLSCAPQESLMRIACSGWMRRLWTLQEGVLARDLYFQFSERAARLQSLISAVDKDWSQKISPVGLDAVQCGSHFQKFKDMRENQLPELINALQWRNTSWQSDEPICLSILLDLDAELVAGADPEVRMKTFLSLLKSLPARILFAPGPRIQEDGYHWAPLSLMPRIAYTFPLNDGIPPSVQGPLGLMAVLPGFFLSPRNVPVNDIAFFTVEGSAILYRVANYGVREDAAPSWRDAGPHNIDNPAIVVGRNLLEGGADEWGVLVSIYQEAKHNTYLARFQCRVLIMRETDEFPEEILRVLLAREASRTDSTAYLGVAEILTPEQRWCIR